MRTTEAYSSHIKEKKILCRYNDIYVVITTFDGCRYNEILSRYYDFLSRYTRYNNLVITTYYLVITG